MRLIQDQLVELDRLDKSVYEAIAQMQTPRLDRSMRALSRTADYSKLSLAASAALAIAGGAQGRRARAGALRQSRSPRRS
jgi:hypothetical protein